MKEKVIKDFLLDIECLDALSKWTDKFNLFDVLKITRTEIRHSNVLAWLLSPDENHGFEDRILKGFIQYVVKNFSDDKDVFSTLLMNFHSFVIQREWHNIDILALSEDEKFILCIENKIDTGEHDNQLNRYKEIVEKNYPNYKAMYIFLSPQGNEASDSENWYSMSYQDDSGWKTSNHYFFEIRNNNGKEFSIQFVLSSENKTEEQSKIFEKINVLYPSKQQKDNWLWRTHFSSKHYKIEDEINEEKVLSQLDKAFAEAIEFQKKLISQLK